MAQGAIEGLGYLELIELADSTKDPGTLRAIEERLRALRQGPQRLGTREPRVQAPTPPEDMGPVERMIHELPNTGTGKKLRELIARAEQNLLDAAIERGRLYRCSPREHLWAWVHNGLRDALGEPRAERARRIQGILDVLTKHQCQG